MNDVVKTNVKRDQNSKRVRRRNRNKALYIFLVLILVLGIGVLLSVTLLFNIGKINIKGEVDYSDEN
ncbi:MAG: cell division protein FtsQ, partial [Oscillospiraceae bacterium]|nr:cell division protein FtsQ [Oscillospiraceae bacterium]